jgi:diaminopimelate epimerase
MSGARAAFEKWEGLGNDFVVVEVNPALWPGRVVRAVCDRRRGVGADGVLFVDRCEAGMPRMVVRNADGSRPEMCGNGLRCVAGYLATRGAFDGDGGWITIATDVGPRRCEVRASSPVSFDVAVEMGPAKILGTFMVEIDGRQHAFTHGDVGNPHAITFAAYDEATIDRIGPIVARFPDGGTNVEFCKLVRSETSRVEAVEVVVWERGVGRTLACGTGACAVASAACAAGFRAYGAPLRVRLPGGELSIVIEAGSHAATMRGPARQVFTGEVEIP